MFRIAALVLTIGMLLPPTKATRYEVCFSRIPVVWNACVVQVVRPGWRVLWQWRSERFNRLVTVIVEERKPDNE